MESAEMTHNELGIMIDAVYALRTKRLELAREVDKLKVEEDAAKAKIREILVEYGLAKASGAIATVGQVHKIEPNVSDWEAVHNYIKEKDRFDLLQKRISVPAWRELYEGGELIPGTDPIDIYDISLTKSTRG